MGLYLVFLVPFCTCIRVCLSRLRTAVSFFFHSTIEPTKRKMVTLHSRLMTSMVRYPLPRRVRGTTATTQPRKDTESPLGSVSSTSELNTTWINTNCSLIMVHRARITPIVIVFVLRYSRCTRDFAG